MSNREFVHLIEKWRRMNHEEQLTLKKISEIEGVSYGTVRRYFKRYNIEVKDNSVENEKRTKTIKMLKEGVGQRKISRELGISRNYVKKVAKRLEIVFETNERNLIINENYFEKIDTHEKAYWLGYIYADGCIVYRGQGKSYQLALGLKKDDKSILEKIKKTLDSSSPIRYNKINQSFQMEITSEKMFRDLEQWGVKQRKSLILAFPEKLNEKYYNSFILGYFDGDGCIYQHPIRKKMVQFDLVATEGFLEKVQEILVRELDLNFTKIRKNGNISRMVYTGRQQIGKIHNWIYKDIEPNLPLERKKEVFIQIKESMNKKDL